MNRMAARLSPKPRAPGTREEKSPMAAQGPDRPPNDDQPIPDAPHATDKLMAAIAEEIPRLRRFARVLARGNDLADDLVQDTLVRAIAARASFSEGTNLRAWLFAILRNVHLSLRRRASRSPLLPAPEEMPMTPVSGGQEEGHAMRDLGRAFESLPKAQQQVLWLTVVEGMEYEDVAQVLGTPVGTVRSRLSRAREALRVAMQGAAPKPPSVS
jgi:RNA polymerase sigma-70 factor (ECF subfamily)